MTPPFPEAPAHGGGDPRWLDDVLETLVRRRGIDFRGYRRATLARRVQNRMLTTRDATVTDYLARLRTESTEPDALIERLTIKVSRFFRDPAACAVVAGELAQSAAGPGERFEAWSAGCAYGEEAYTLAMLLAENLAGRAFGVLATDLDVPAVIRTRHARYPEDSLAGLEKEGLARRFEPASGRRRNWRPRADLRAAVSARTHDLTSGALPAGCGPFDLIACRNVLIYLLPATQLRVLALLQRGLRPRGLLWLGEAEWLPPQAAGGFDVVDRRARLFRRRPAAAEAPCP